MTARRAGAPPVLEHWAPGRGSPVAHLSPAADLWVAAAYRRPLTAICGYQAVPWAESTLPVCGRCVEAVCLAQIRLTPAVRRFVAAVLSLTDPVHVVPYLPHSPTLSLHHGPSHETAWFGGDPLLFQRRTVLAAEAVGAVQLTLVDLPWHSSARGWAVTVTPAGRVAARSRAAPDPRAAPDRSTTDTTLEEQTS